MWGMILSLSAFAAIVAASVLSAIVLEELTDLPDAIRRALRRRAGGRPLDARVKELESRLATLERRIARHAA